MSNVASNSRVKIPINRYRDIRNLSTLGGRRYAELYGSPGTPEGRRKGGLKAQEKLRSNPELVKNRAIATRKKIRYTRRSVYLAEFIGIMLGDGGVSNDYQISISFNPKQDLKYAYYLQRLIAKLFLVSSTVRIREKYGTGDIIVTGRNLVEFLNRQGIKKGNKVVGKIDIPRWIWSSERFKIACLRGLVDTDGCFYRHKYIVNGKRYTYLKMCLTSYSPPLFKSATVILKDLGLQPKNTAKNRVYIYSLSNLHKYFKIAGTNNPRYFHTYNNFCKQL